MNIASPMFSESAAASAENDVQYWRNTAEVRRVHFVLLSDASLFDVYAAVELLHEVNSGAGTQVFEPILYSADDVGEESHRSSLPIKPLSEIDGDQRLIILFGGRSVTKAGYPLVKLLRHAKRFGATVAGVGGGVFVLASAGLLDGNRCTTHWQLLSSLRELHPELEVTNAAFEIDGRCITCAGGVSTLDLMYTIIKHEKSSYLAQRAADALLYDVTMESGTQYRMGTTAWLATHSPKLARAVQLMRENCEAPLSIDDIALEVGTTTRQIQRQFRKTLGMAPYDYYTEIRLQHARRLLLNSEMQIGEVGYASGFQTHSHFTVRYREYFFETPKMTREQNA